MGIKICPDCGGKVSESRDTCIHCGYIFPKPKPQKKCPDCEALVDEDVNECPECGYYFVLPAALASKNEEEKKPKEKENPKKEEHEHKIANVVCSGCGSTDCEKLDEYTYKCRNCSSIIKIKKPDVNVYNINSFAGDPKTADVPVYQVVRNLDEEEFVRKTVLFLAKQADVSPLFLEKYRADKSMVDLAYITFVTKEYSVDISYSCDIGTDYKVTYYRDGKEQSRTETRWEPFSGTASDGGYTTYCAFGDETEIDAFIPVFFKDDYDFQEFKEEQRFPLKPRADRSSDEAAKARQIASLESSCRSNLPGDRSRNFRSHGRCTLSDIVSYYYVPSFTLLASSDGHEIVFFSVANQNGRMSHVFAEDKKVANMGDETMPKRKKASAQFKNTSFGTVSLLCIILLPIFIGLSFIFSLIFFSFLFYIFIPFYIAALVVVIVMRVKTISKIHSNLIYKFKQRKLSACIRCLEENNLTPLSDEERSELL